MGDFSLLFTYVRSLWHEHLLDIHPELTRGVLPTLLSIVRTQPVTATDLAFSLGADKTIISKHVTHLRQIGMVEACVSPDDGRVFLLNVSEDGLNRISSVRRQLMVDYEERFTDWSDEEIAALQKGLHRFLTQS